MWSWLEPGSPQPGIDVETRTQTMTSMTEDRQEAVTASVEEGPPRLGAR